MGRWRRREPPRYKKRPTVTVVRAHRPGQWVSNGYWECEIIFTILYLSYTRRTPRRNPGEDGGSQTGRPLISRAQEPVNLGADARPPYTGKNPNARMPTKTSVFIFWKCRSTRMLWFHYVCVSYLTDKPLLPARNDSVYYQHRILIKRYYFSNKHSHIILFRPRRKP